MVFLYRAALDGCGLTKEMARHQVADRLVRRGPGPGPAGDVLSEHSSLLGNPETGGPDEARLETEAPIERPMILSVERHALIKIIKRGAIEIADDRADPRNSGRNGLGRGNGGQGGGDPWPEGGRRGTARGPGTEGNGRCWNCRAGGAEDSGHCFRRAEPIDAAPERMTAARTDDPQHALVPQHLRQRPPEVIMRALRSDSQ